jgi:hypothetical protein
MITNKGWSLIPWGSPYFPLPWSKTMKSMQHLGEHLLDGLLVSLCLVLSQATGAIATPAEPIGCPEGWKSYAPEPNSRISVCVPKQLIRPLPMDLGQQPTRVQVQQLRIIQTGTQGHSSTIINNRELRSGSHTSIQVYQRTSQSP